MRKNEIGQREERMKEGEGINPELREAEKRTEESTRNGQRLWEGVW